MDGAMGWVVLAAVAIGVCVVVALVSRWLGPAEMPEKPGFDRGGLPQDGGGSGSD